MRTPAGIPLRSPAADVSRAPVLACAGQISLIRLRATAGRAGGRLPQAPLTRAEDAREKSAGSPRLSGSDAPLEAEAEVWAKVFEAAVEKGTAASRSSSQPAHISSVVLTLFSGS